MRSVFHSIDWKHRLLNRVKRHVELTVPCQDKVSEHFADERSDRQTRGAESVRDDQLFRSRESTEHRNRIRRDGTQSDPRLDELSFSESRGRF